MNWFQRFKVNRLYSKALKYYYAKDYQRSMDTFKKMRLIDHRLVEAISGIGLCKFELGEIEEAIDYVDMAIELEPDGIYHLFNKVIYLIEKKALREALLLSNEIVEREGMNPDYLKQNGQLLFEHKMYEKALQVYKKHLSVCDDKQMGYIYLSECYSKLGAFEKGINMLELSLLENPKDVVSLNNIGFYRLQIGEYEKSIVDFNKAIEVDHTFAFAYNNKGFAYLKLGKLKEALEYIQQSIKLDDKNSYAFKNLAFYYLEINSKEKAIENLRISKNLGYLDLYGNEVDLLLNDLLHEK